ncbi:hypothetical protein PLESTB_000107200 [Pleodorina starrii]|uniref:Uncharacterized protein n=1 Tax=Pleodorina starrii TaxID=330485 RepID=A0A9W6EXB4_9CHLO|nr:hypothetical protein PLESTB_000107200 [Pleodorina starrii]
MQPPPGAGVDAYGNVMDRTLVVDSQELLYTLATALLLMGALVWGHTLLVVLYKLLNGPELPATLQFPRVEIRLAGGGRGDKFDTSRIPALLVLWILVMPYLTLLWWLTVCRWYLEAKPLQAPQKKLSLGSGSDARSGIAGGGRGGDANMLVMTMARLHKAAQTEWDEEFGGPECDWPPEPAGQLPPETASDNADDEAGSSTKIQDGAEATQRLHHQSGNPGDPKATVVSEETPADMGPLPPTAFGKKRPFAPLVEPPAASGKGGVGGWTAASQEAVQQQDCSELTMVQQMSGCLVTPTWSLGLAPSLLQTPARASAFGVALVPALAPTISVLNKPDVAEPGLQAKGV